jgi:hypothetical protein
MFHSALQLHRKIAQRSTLNAFHAETREHGFTKSCPAQIDKGQPRYHGREIPGGPSNISPSPAGWITTYEGSTEAHCCEQVSIDHPLGGYIVIAFVSANSSPRLRSQDSIDGSTIVTSSSKSALYLYDRVSIAISGIVITVVVVRVVPIVGVRIEDWKPKRVEEDERSIMEMAEAIVTIVVAVVKPPMHSHYGPWCEVRCWPRHCGSRHHWRGMCGRRCRSCSQAQRGDPD